MKHRILIAVRDAPIRKILIDTLADSFEIVEADNGAEVINIVHSEKVELLILDITLPKKDGFEVVETLRVTSQMPVMMISGFPTLEYQLKAYELGVDDYITYSCDPALILAKVKRMIARTYLEKQPKAELVFKELRVNKRSRTVKIDQQEVNFCPKEFDLLALLMERQGEVLGRDIILDKLWGIDYFGDYRVVDSHIKKVRKKLGSYASCIRTQYSVGYKFEEIEIED